MILWGGNTGPRSLQPCVLCRISFSFDFDPRSIARKRLFVHQFNQELALPTSWHGGKDVVFVYSRVLVFCTPFYP
jgi:hypothetical protein